jgi:hypothetical protein
MYKVIDVTTLKSRKRRAAPILISNPQGCGFLPWEDDMVAISQMAQVEPKVQD